LNFKRATPRSDIYSFGALLHDIFASNPRRLPHEELTAPGDIGPVIERCTKRNSFRRFKDVGQVREALFNALNNYQFVYQSNEEQEAVELLASETQLPNADQWDAIFDFLDITPDDGGATTNLFRVLRLDHIQQLNRDDPDLMAALGNMFADHCRLRSFDYNYCDVLASKAQLFYDLGEIDLKAKIAIAMLILGLDHNRWFVERKFVQMVAPSISEALIQRVIVEMNVLQIDFNSEFLRMQTSIAITSESLHPQLREILSS